MPKERTRFQKDLDAFERRLGEPEMLPPAIPWFRRMRGLRSLERVALGLIALMLGFVVGYIWGS